MTPREFREFLTLLMVSDPWPTGVNGELLWRWADHEAKRYGFSNWIEAYHKMEVPS